MWLHRILCRIDIHAFDKHEDAVGRRWACGVCGYVTRPDGISL